MSWVSTDEEEWASDALGVDGESDQENRDIICPGSDSHKVVSN